MSNQTEEQSIDLIIIDDNSSLTDAWKFYGKSVGKRVKAFNTIPSINEIINYNINIPIYIDSDLGCAISGQEYAKELHELGFLNLYLSTGFPANYFGDLPWIKEIIGKEPPF